MRWINFARFIDQLIDRLGDWLIDYGTQSLNSQAAVWPLKGNEKNEREGGKAQIHLNSQTPQKFTFYELFTGKSINVQLFKELFPQCSKASGQDDVLAKSEAIANQIETKS